MRDDIIPPALTLEQKHGALQVRHDRIMLAVRRWNAKAAECGFDGVEDALDSLMAMKRGPRALTQTTGEPRE